MALDNEEYLLSDDSETSENSNKGAFRGVVGRTFKRFATAVARTAESAQALIKDEELRKRGAGIIAERARTLQQEVKKNAASAVREFQKAPKSLQTVLGSVQQRINEARLRARLEATKDTPVDVQVGLELYKSIPQEWRSRLWLALLNRPEVVEGFRELAEEHRVIIRNRLMVAQRTSSSASFAAPSPSSDTAAPLGPTPSALTANVESRSSFEADASSPHSLAAPVVPNGQQHNSAVAAAAHGTTAPAAAASQPSGSAASGGERRLAAAAAVAAPGVGVNESEEDKGKDSEEAPSPFATAPQQQQAPAAADGALQGGLPSQARNQSSVAAAAIGEGGSSSGTEGGEAGNREQDGDGHEEEGSSQRQVGREAGDLGDWEVLQGGAQGGRADRQGRWLLLHAGGQAVDWSKEAKTKQEALEDAVDAVGWPAATSPDPEGRYTTLLQITTGQEEVDEVISRDIHRTFPEHPQFGFEQGQQELYRVLKAYSVADLEVGYCQGMAFVAGVLLMYLPEEPAFRAISRLLLPPEGSLDGAVRGGADLRTLYLPTMDGLKAELRRFEWLMARFLPSLLEHLESHGVVSVLYAAQWFLTAFSCPFPPAFSCRVIDVMLIEGSGGIMQRAALAVMAECAADLMALDDFEEIITFLKMQLAGWTGKRARRVLSSAYMSPITDELLANAAEAVEAGFTGSLSRVPSRRHSVAVDLDDELRNAGSIVHGGLTPSSSEGTLHGSDRGVAAGGGAGGALGGPSGMQSRGSGRSLRGEEENQYLRIVLDMDTVWTGGGTPADDEDALDIDSPVSSGNLLLPGRSGASLAVQRGGQADAHGAAAGLAAVKLDVNEDGNVTVSIGAGRKEE